MTKVHKQWLPMMAIIFASSILFTGCKSSSWTSLPGMSYFAKKDAPAAAYYGNDQRPANGYAAGAVDHSSKYNGDPAAGDQRYYSEQYNSTNQGNSNYLAGYPNEAQELQGQPAYQAPGQGGPQYNTATNQQPTYDGQPQYPPQQQPQYPPQQPQYQPQQPQYQPQQPQYQPQQPQYQPQQPQYQPQTTQPAPAAGSIQDGTTAPYNRGFYDPNTGSIPQAGTAAPATDDTFILGPAPYTSPTPANNGPAAVTAELPNQTPQFDGSYNPETPSPSSSAPMPEYRPGSTGNTNSYYTPGSTYNGQ